MTLRERFEAVNSGPWTTAGEDVQYRIERIGSKATLYFQCTASKSDWRANLDFPAVPYKRQPVLWFAHRGFVRLYKSVRDQLKSDLCGVTHLEIVGYSQGAALATLAHEDISYGSDISVVTYAFASPRVLWLAPKSVVSRFDNVLRVSVTGDLVLHTPPSLFGFRHVGMEHLVGPKSAITADNHRPETYLKYL